MAINLNKQNSARRALAHFLETPLDTTLNRQDSDDPRTAILTLFQHVAASVPAYQAFLAAHGIAPESIQSITDFGQLPSITKKNYIQQHPLPALCRNGELTSSDFLAVSSGSTGRPTFWPRFIADELQITTRFEQVFHDSFQADQCRTLAVVCFTLGTWVGGMFTSNCCRYLVSKGYPLTVITPGNNRDEILRVVQEMGSFFDQVVLLGYPPALKDIIDVGRARGVEWPRYQIKLVMAGEVFSEEWRTLVGERTGSLDHCYSSAALYGTADAGILANETPLSICIRRYLAAHPAAARELFGESRLPTLAQYDPFSRYFEADGQSLLFSGDNGVPLIRYNILDTGGIVPYETMLGFLADHGFDPIAALAASATSAIVGEPPVRGMRRLPFVYVFGRSDFTVSFFGANIYPENITVGLEQPEISAWVTGKFVLEVREQADNNPFLSITIELAPGIADDDSKQQAISDSIMTHLLRLNSEFANYVPPEYRPLQVRLAPISDPEYFPIGVKHRYTRR